MNPGALTYEYIYTESADRARGNTKPRTQRTKAAIALKLALLLCDPKVRESSYLFGNFTNLCQLVITRNIERDLSEGLGKNRQEAF
jgi:hypothetical protein